MPLFERGYRAAARTELERDIRRIEEKDKKAQTKIGEAEFNKGVDTMYSNINFAERLNLISEEQARAYRERAEKATVEFNNMQKEEHDEIVDDFENPRERSERYMSMEDAQAQIAQERADANAQQSHNEQTHSETSKTVDDSERQR